MLCIDEVSGRSKKFKKGLTPLRHSGIVATHTVNTNYIHMRIKALCLAAAAASLVTTVAQAQNVYSMNVVGYHQVTIQPNKFGLIANQLNTTNNTLQALLPSVPPNTLFYKYVNGSWQPSQFDEFDLKWTDGTFTLNPGEGGFIKNVDTAPLTLTFVGEVLQGGLTNALPAGLAVRSSMVPQQGLLTTDLGYPAAANDTVYTYADGYTPFQFDEFDLKWTPSEPTIKIGEAFFSKKVAAENWTRNFTVPTQ